MSTVTADPIRLGCRLGRDDARAAVATGSGLTGPERPMLLQQAHAHFCRHASAGTEIAPYGAEIAWARFAAGYVLGFEEVLLASERRSNVPVRRPHRAQRSPRHSMARAATRRSRSSV